MYQKHADVAAAAFSQEVPTETLHLKLNFTVDSNAVLAGCTRRMLMWQILLLAQS
jgi:hypothetical protein